MNEQLQKEARALLHALSQKSAEVTTLEEFNRVSHLYTLALRRLASRAPASHSEGLSLPSFDVFGGLFDGFAGLGLLLESLIGLFSLSWLFGPSQPAAVPLALYAVPLELGVMVHNALVNRGVRATAVEFAVSEADVMEEFFFNVPETQTWLAEHIMRSLKVMWRKVDE